LFERSLMLFDADCINKVVQVGMGILRSAFERSTGSQGKRHADQNGNY